MSAVAFISVVSKALCSKGQVDAVYFDFSKAFNIVDHGILL